MSYRVKFSFLFIIISLISVLHSKDEPFFEAAKIEEREYLVDFAVESNDIYRTRTASIDAARKVFDIPKVVFEQGVVETLKQKGEIVGFYTLRATPFSDEWFEWELGHLFVKKGLQRQGLGSMLFKRATSVAFRKGWKKLEWCSDPGAEVFYLKMGAIITGYCENILNPSFDLPIFEYSLDFPK